MQERWVLVDYCEVNKRKVKNKYPIPLVEELLDELREAKGFAKLNLHAGYHQIKMEPKDTNKTTFRTHSGHYEWLVMPFGFINALATFQGAMNNILREYLRKFVLVFVHDILVHCPCMEFHVQHLHKL